MMDFDLSRRSSLNVERELEDRRWMPIQKSSTPFNAPMTALFNHLQNEKGQDGISALILDCAAAPATTISETQKR